VIGVGEYRPEALDDQLKGWLYRYEQVPSVTDVEAMTRAVRVPNRSMVPVFEAAGMAVRYVEARDGHSWENWRDRLRDGLSWIFPGPQKFFYE